MDANRRKFLQISTGGLVASMSLPMMSLFSSGAHAAIVPNQRKVIVLHLDGGNDGLNTVIPIDSVQYAQYQAMRPTIQIPLADILPVGFDSSNIEFGLHPSFASLMPYINNLALFPATHTGVNSNRSHFFQHDVLDAGLYTGNTHLADGKGWLGRYLDGKYLTQPEGIVAQDFAGGEQFLMDGTTFVLRFKDPENQKLGTSTKSVSDAIWADMQLVNTGAGTPGTHNYNYSYEQRNVFNEIMPRLATVGFSRIPSVTYPTGLGTNLKKTVDMLIALPELEVIHLTQGGYDTHLDQNKLVNGHASILKTLSDSLAAFYADLSNYPDLINNVAVVVMSEFGRTAKENVSLGTDHGQATSWMVFGGGIRGGVYGSYPGLNAVANAQFPGLESSDWLRTNIDYRDIFSELMGPSFMGRPVAEVNALFPGGYAGAPNPLNFIL